MRVSWMGKLRSSSATPSTRTRKSTETQWATSRLFPMFLTSCESKGQHEKQHGNTVSDNRRDPSQERICRIAEVMFDASEVAARERRVSDCPKAGVQSYDMATSSQGA